MGKRKRFRCGKLIPLGVYEISDVEYCGHHCPDPTIRGDVNSCRIFMEIEKQIEEDGKWYVEMRKMIDILEKRS